MERLVCLALICVASALADITIDPRGSRPVEQGTRDEKCASQKEWPFCADDEWGYKCPSGCRIQGLMDKNDHSMLKTIEEIRSLLDQNTVKHRTAEQSSKETHNYVREKLTVDAGNDISYNDLAHNLQRKITEMKIKIVNQQRTLAALKDRVKQQVVEMQLLEVDIDIKLRSCKGSCAGYSEYQVDKESYVALDKQVSQLDNQTPQEPAASLKVMKSRSLQDSMKYKKKSKDIDGHQGDGAFQGVRNMELYTVEGTSSTVQGTSSTSSSSSEVKGGTATHTVTVTCTKTETTVYAEDGTPVRTEEVIVGGPDCEIMSMGGLDDSLSGQTPPPSSSSSSSSSYSYTSSSSSSSPSLQFKSSSEVKDSTTTHTVSSSSSSSSHTSSSSSSSSSGGSSTNSGGTKGSVLGGSTSGFWDPFGKDFDPFNIGNGEDDKPDFQARSVKSGRVERQADYVGQDCVAANRNHLKGEMNGLFKIRPGGTGSTKVVEVYCQQEGLIGGWLLVQQRESGVVSFNRTWAEYSHGFGSVDARGRGGFWLGNQNLHQLTNQGETMLKVELEDWEGGAVSAEYTIRVGAGEEGYPLHVSGYSGDAGDALATSQPSHDGMKFSTFDKDNDKSEGNCAQTYGGGWWYNSCQAANLNGMYYEANKPAAAENGVVWSTYKSARYSLKTVRMWIRSTAF